MKKGHCSTCGARLSPLDKREGGYRWHPIIEVKDIRSLVDGRAEESPQLLIHLSIYRNGGSEDPVCDECVKAALVLLADHIKGLIDVI